MRGKISRIATILTGLSAILFTTSAVAEGCCVSAPDSCMSAPYGWYAEINLGSTRISNVSYPGKSSSSGIGGNLNLGYKFMPYFWIGSGLHTLCQYLAFRSIRHKCRNCQTLLLLI